MPVTVFITQQSEWNYAAMAFRGRWKAARWNISGRWYSCSVLGMVNELWSITVWIRFVINLRFCCVTQRPKCVCVLCVCGCMQPHIAYHTRTIYASTLHTLACICNTRRQHVCRYVRVPIYIHSLCTNVYRRQEAKSVQAVDVGTQLPFAICAFLAASIFHYYYYYYYCSYPCRLSYVYHYCYRC